MEPVGALKWLLILTIKGIPATVKVCIIRIVLDAHNSQAKVLVVATVFRSAVAEDIPVVSVPLLPSAKAMFANTAVRTSASVLCQLLH